VDTEVSLMDKVVLLVWSLNTFATSLQAAWQPKTTRIERSDQPDGMMSAQLVPTTPKQERARVLDRLYRIRDEWTSLRHNYAEDFASEVDEKLTAAAGLLNRQTPDKALETLPDEIRSIAERLEFVLDKDSQSEPTKNRYVPPSCPECGSKVKVTSSKPEVRYLVCTSEKCDFSVTKSR
jgi:hypothetical protein